VCGVNRGGRKKEREKRRTVAAALPKGELDYFCRPSKRKRGGGKKRMNHEALVYENLKIPVPDGGKKKEKGALGRFVSGLDLHRSSA